MASVRGQGGNPSPTDLNTSVWKENGPFELSPERGHFALLYSLVENQSFFFSLPLAQFTVPDLGFINNHYVSLFAPGVSFLSIPGYWLGKVLGLSQVGAFFTISLVALTNAYLIRKISINLGVGHLASTIAGLTFLFVTPGYAYAVNLYQHHWSTLLVLLGILCILRPQNFTTFLQISFLSAASIPIDYPNAIFMAPIFLYSVSRLIKVEKSVSRIKVIIKFLPLLGLIGALLPLLFLFWFNQKSYANPLQISGTIKTVKGIGSDSLPLSNTQTVQPKDVIFKIEDLQRKKVATRFFKPRIMPNGLFVEFISLDRGTLFFTPVILIGLLGIYISFKRNTGITPLLISIFVGIIILYSMWGDPWGGWAFGSRYLIPAYAILAIFLAQALDRFKKSFIFLLIFLVLFIYSAAVNTLGAITTSTNPPQTEILALEKITGRQEKYTWERNWDYLNSTGSKSFVYNTYLKTFLTPVQFYWILTGSIISLGTILLITNRFSKN